MHAMETRRKVRGTSSVRRRASKPEPRPVLVLVLIALVAIVIGLGWLFANPAWNPRGDLLMAPGWGVPGRVPF